MIKYLTIFILTIFLLTHSDQIVAQNSNLHAAKNVSMHPLENNAYRNIIEPVTFSDSSKIYSKPDTNSAVLQVFKFKTHLRLLGEGDDTKEIRTEMVRENGEKYSMTQFTNLRWYSVELIDGIGYIKASDVATHTFTDENGLFDYFFQTSGNCYLFKYDRNKKQFIDSLEIKSVRGDLIHSISPNGWKNVNMLFRTTMINAFCGGGTTNVFIVDANGKLSELISTKSYSDDGSADAYSSNVWLPIKFDKGKILLIDNGDVENVFDINSGQLNTYTYPKELTFPKIELIVLKEIEEKSLYSSNGEPILNANGSYKSKAVKNTVIYFRWNGAKLDQIK